MLKDYRIEIKHIDLGDTTLKAQATVYHRDREVVVHVGHSNLDKEIKKEFPTELQIKHILSMLIDASIRSMLDDRKV